MKTSEVLQRVWVHLGDGKTSMVSHQRFICHALDFLYYKIGVIGDRDRTRVKKIINGHLDGAFSLEHWLDIHHDIEIKNSRAYRRKIMVTRHAWLAHLFEHYQSKGD